MKYGYVLLLLLCNYAVHAATTVNITLCTGGEPIQKSLTYNDPNSPTHIIDCGKHTIEATIIEENEEGLLFEFKVFDPAAESEHTKLIASPRVKAAWNEKARLECVGQSHNNFALELIATKS